jgi:hypothetical protein
MDRRTVLTGSAAALTTALAGCSLGGDGGDGSDEGVDPADSSTGATSEQTLRLTVNGDAAGSEWESVSATYPRDRFTVESAQHENIGLDIDTSGDGNADEEFGAGAISGANNNEFSFTIELDTGYTLQEGDTVIVDYPAVGNPEEAGDYEVELSINEAQTETVTLTIG